MADPSTQHGSNRASLAGAGLVLLGTYVVLSFTMSTGGYLGTDTGAKVATIDVMARSGSWQPDLGYWAEGLDPDGRFHPIYDSKPVGDGWVHVTTLPMVLAARPLYALGGYRLALVLPMAGAVGAAFAARALARRLGSVGDGPATGAVAFWTVGLLSPITVYALDLWEHSIGVACMVAAVAVLGRVVEGSLDPRWSAVGGALLGAAATMRTEAFVYALVAVGLAASVVLARSRRLRPPLRLGGAVAGFAVPWILNRVVESAVGGLARGDRVAGATASGGGEVVTRLREAWTTLVAVRPADGAEVLGVLLVGSLVAAVVYQRRGDRRVVRLALAGSTAIHVALLLSGVGFVPGMLAAAPVAIVGLLSWPMREARMARDVLGVALGALPFVWAFQFLGGARPQWGGRYALTSCTLLVVVGVASLVARRDRLLQVGFLGLSALVTVSGVAWLHERSHAVERYFDQLVERPEAVVIVRNGFLVREGGAAYAERRWLTAVSDDDLVAAVDLVDRAQLETFAVLDERRSAPLEIGGASLQQTSRTTVVGTTFFLHSYAFSGE